MQQQKQSVISFSELSSEAVRVASVRVSWEAGRGCGGNVSQSDAVTRENPPIGGGAPAPNAMPAEYWRVPRQFWEIHHNTVRRQWVRQHCRDRWLANTGNVAILRAVSLLLPHRPITGIECHAEMHQGTSILRSEYLNRYEVKCGYFKWSKHLETQPGVWSQSDCFDLKLQSHQKWSLSSEAHLEYCCLWLRSKVRRDQRSCRNENRQKHYHCPDELFALS